MQNLQDKKEARCIFLTERGRFITIIFIIISFGLWTFLEIKKQNGSFIEPFIGLLGIMDTALLGLLGIYTTRQENRAIAKRDADLRAYIAEKDKKSKTALENHTLQLSALAESLADKRHEKDHKDHNSILKSVELAHGDIKQIYDDLQKIPALIQENSAKKEEITSDIDSHDLEVLKELWLYISFNKIKQLFDGFKAGSINHDWILHFDIYSERRQNPKFRLYNSELENELQKFDQALDNVLETGMNTFESSENSKNSFHIRDGNLRKKIVKEAIEPATIIYNGFINILKDRKIYHILEDIQ